jgi:hypothetical protein
MMNYFSCSGWPGADMRILEKAAKTLYAELMFLHLVKSLGHVVHSGVPTPQNIDALFFMLRWARCDFHKKRVKSRYAELVFFASGAISGSCSGFWGVGAMKHQRTIFHSQVGPMQIPQKAN